MAVKFVAMFFFLTSFLIDFPSVNSTESPKSNKGFTTNLVRRDHPPKYDGSSVHSVAYFDWLARSFNRSTYRADHFHHQVISKKKQKSLRNLQMVVDSPIAIGEGDYIKEVSIGTPPVRIRARIDTGSDLAWTQCLPCRECYKQYDPIFDPENSSTYGKLSCDSQPCKALLHTPCNKSHQCTYIYRYMDNPKTRGNLAVDTFTFHSNDGNNISFPNTMFGCGHQNSGIFSKMESGIIGLGPGNFSIVNQFSSIISRKFSYCLAHIDTSPISKISFGVDAVPPGSKAVSTPMVKLDELNLYYFVTLEAVSVGNQRYELMYKYGSQPTDLDEGNMFLDSGTTATSIPMAIYNDLRGALMDIIKKPPVADPEGSLDLCYANDPSLKLPEFVFHFNNSANVVIPPENAFSQIQEKVVCWQIRPIRGKDQWGVFGNQFQTNLLIEYDLDNQIISFLPTDCSEEHL